VSPTNLDNDSINLVFKAAMETQGAGIFVRKSPAHTIGLLGDVMIRVAGFNLRHYPTQAVRW
jgi:hypothetical protein